MLSRLGGVRVASMTSGRQRVLSDTLLSVSRAYSTSLTLTHVLGPVFCVQVIARGLCYSKTPRRLHIRGVVAVSGFNLNWSMMNPSPTR